VSSSVRTGLLGFVFGVFIRKGPSWSWAENCGFQVPEYYCIPGHFKVSDIQFYRLGVSTVAFGIRCKLALGTHCARAHRADVPSREPESARPSSEPFQRHLQEHSHGHLRVRDDASPRLLFRAAASRWGRRGPVGIRVIT
jgi:hypothetical protein